MENTPLPSQRKLKDLAFFKLVLAWIIAITIAVGLQTFVFQSYQVFGHSMEPTLQNGDYLIISKLGPTWAQIQNRSYLPNRGDIIVIEPQGSPRLIKRVIGLPDEQIVIRNGRLLVFNDQNPDGFDPYEEIGLTTEEVSGSITVDIPSDQIFVVGDNRSGSGSSDSRNQLGTIPVDNVVGSLVLRLWPASSLELF